MKGFQYQLFQNEFVPCDDAPVYYPDGRSETGKRGPGLDKKTYLKKDLVRVLSQCRDALDSDGRKIVDLYLKEKTQRDMRAEFNLSLGSVIVSADH